MTFIFIWTRIRFIHGEWNFQRNGRILVQIKMKVIGVSKKRNEKFTEPVSVQKGIRGLFGCFGLQHFHTRIQGIMVLNGVNDIWEIAHDADSEDRCQCTHDKRPLKGLPVFADKVNEQHPTCKNGAKHDGREFDIDHDDQDTGQQEEIKPVCIQENKPGHDNKTQQEGTKRTVHVGT